MKLNFNPNIWGPKGWFFIDTIILSYPNNPTELEKKQYRNFFYSFPVILPCKKCRIHFNEYIEQNPLNDEILSSKDNIIKWILQSHNNIRKTQISIEDYYTYYNNKPSYYTNYLINSY